MVTIIEENTIYVELFGCRQGQIPVSYLRIPIHYRKLTNVGKEHAEQRIQKGLTRWKLERKTIILEWKIISH
jgi:hypothetical protein